MIDLIFDVSAGEGWKGVFETARTGSAANEALTQDQRRINQPHHRLLREEPKLGFNSDGAVHALVHSCTHAGFNDGDYLCFRERSERQTFIDAVHLSLFYIWQKF